MVESIEQDEDGVSVVTADGANFTAKYALFTPSLGVLKAGDISFEPPLPAAKLAAIEQMGFGLLDKAVFVFDKPFWDTSGLLVGRVGLHAGLEGRCSSGRAASARPSAHLGLLLTPPLHSAVPPPHPLSALQPTSSCARCPTGAGAGPSF